MRPIKDNFSDQASLYKKYRPNYPEALYDLILSHCKNFDLTWDCATGNGQVAEVLSKHFDQVVATDISAEQLSHAIQAGNINYRQGRAEASGLENNSIDLLTIGQAIHWFDFDKFYAEAKRVLKTDGLIAAWTYGTFRVREEIDLVIDHFYSDVVGPYWDDERSYIDKEYRTIPFPFTEIATNQNLWIERNWSIQDIEGYLNTWSGVAHYRREHKSNPVDDVITRLAAHWAETEKVRFPLFLRLGKK